MTTLRNEPAFGWIALGVLAFVVGNWTRPPAKYEPSELRVALNVPLQILAAWGDRYLAANAGTWRAIVVDATRMSSSTLAALARIQEDASWLNPAHEDNYYMAAAILPWEGEFERGQTILRRAMEARRGDILPAFFYGFNQIQFLGDWQSAYQAALRGAESAPTDGDRQLMTVTAARWLERSEDADSAIRLTAKLAETTRDRALQDYLRLRVERLENLRRLRLAAKEFESRFGSGIDSLADLVDSGLIERIPEDKVGLGYEVANHLPVLKQKRPTGK